MQPLCRAVERSSFVIQTSLPSSPVGWRVASNLNYMLKKTIIHLPAEVAGLKLGKDLIAEL